jgi:hypothetical protein
MTHKSFIVFEINKKRRMRTTIASGVITDRMLFEAFEKLTSAPDYDSTLNELVDLRQVESLNVTNEGLALLEKRFGAQTFRSPNRVAIVAADDHIFEMARVYESLSWKSELITVTRSLDAALMWLEMPAAEIVVPQSIQ